MKEISSKETAEQAPHKKPEGVEFPTRLLARIHGAQKPNKTDIGKVKPEVVLLASRIEYIGNIKNVDPVEIKEAQEMLIGCYEFIRGIAETPVEHKVAETLESLIQSNKVVLCDCKDICGKEAFGFFYSGREPYIAIDLNHALDYGTAELVDTLFHQGYHAAQHAAGNKNDRVKEETRAWNLGLDMSNKYRINHGETISRTRPYTEDEISEMGCVNSGGGKGFTEICEGASGHETC
jgi:hypothetical protein